MSPALAKAIQVIQQELGKYEHNAMTGGGGEQKVVEIEVEPASTHLAEGAGSDRKATWPATTPVVSGLPRGPCHRTLQVSAIR